MTEPSDHPRSEVLIVANGKAPERMVMNDRMSFIATSPETAGRYSFLAVDIPAGGGPPPHVHEAADEWFYVMDGDPTFHLGERTVTLHTGDFVHIPMGTSHWFEVAGAPVKVLAGYCPAGEELKFLESAGN